jgi:hypothetical protein
VKFDPADADAYPAQKVFRKLESLVATKWVHTLGDGRSSERIAEDLYRRVKQNAFGRHRPEQYHLPIARSYREDGLDEDGDGRPARGLKRT